MNKSFLNSFFNREEHPRRGLMAFEWVIMSYLLITLVVVLIFHERATNAPQMLWFRVGVLALTMVLWGVYRLWPCLALRALRAGAHLALLGLWYPDTFEMNKMFVPNLDHVFAAMEQGVFGFQPALVFAEKCCNHVFSELMCLGYSSYYPIIGTVTLFTTFFIPFLIGFSVCVFCSFELHERKNTKHNNNEHFFILHNLKITTIHLYHPCHTLNS